jgi:hypothetical protein
MGLKNHSRWERHPTYRNGREVVIPNPSGVYLNILEQFPNYRTLNAPLVAGLIDCGYKSIRNDISDLFAPANAYLDLYNQKDGTQLRWLGLSGHQWFMLSEEGADILRQHHASRICPLGSVYRDRRQERGAASVFTS